ncbi:MAG: EscU/YscU/HrcU family type III secretion system export apparatus switch protein [Verrucomicrobiota bacterium]
MSDEAGDKKFDLSDRRRQQLREEGIMPKSVDVSATITLAAGLGLLIGGGGYLVQYLREMMANSLLQVAHPGASLTPQQVGSVFLTGLWLWVAIFLAALAVAVFASQVAQVGLSFADDALNFKFEKLNPWENLQNLFSVSKLTLTGQNFAKLGVIAGFAYMAVKDIQDSAVFARPVSIEELGGAYVTVAWSFGWRIVTALVVLAAADVFWQHWKFNRDHRMTFQEVKEERRSMEASPEVIKKRRMMAKKTSMRRMLENLKEANVVVTNPTHYAVALKYRRGVDEVPIVVAKGIRKSALRIKEAAYDLRIAVREDRPLARGLYKYGRVNQPIPAIFYQGVAVILASLFRQGFTATDPNPGLTRADIDEIMNQDND